MKNAAPDDSQPAERLASRLLVEHARAITVDGIIESQPEMWRALLDRLDPTHDPDDYTERYDRIKAALPPDLQIDLWELHLWCNDDSTFRLQAGFLLGVAAGRHMEREAVMLLTSNLGSVEHRARGHDGAGLRCRRRLAQLTAEKRTDRDPRHKPLARSVVCTAIPPPVCDVTDRRYAFGGREGSGGAKSSAAPRAALRVSVCCPLCQEDRNRRIGAPHNPLRPYEVSPFASRTRWMCCHDSSYPSNCAGDE